MSNRSNNIGATRSAVIFDTRSESDGGPCRKKFVEAITMCLDKASDYISGIGDVDENFSIDAHPRYGKSHLMRVSSVIALNGGVIDGRTYEPMASAVLYLVPYGNLVDQFIDEPKGFGAPDKWRDMERHFMLCRANGGSGVVDSIGRRELDAKGSGRYGADEQIRAVSAFDMRGSCHIIGSTVQLVQKRLPTVEAWVKQRIKEDPLHRPVWVYWDEVQSIAENKWAGVYDRLTAAGAFHVGVTGTITRDDGSLISGVRRSLIDVQRQERHVTVGRKDAEQEGEIWLEKRTDQREHVRFTDSADISIPPSVGYEEGYLCKVDGWHYDVGTQRFAGLLGDGEEAARIEQKMLSEVTTSVAQEVVGKLVRAPYVAKGMLRIGLSRLKLHLQHVPDARMIVFCGADQPVTATQEEKKRYERDLDRHLKEVEKWIVELQPDLQGKICRLTGNALEERNEQLVKAIHNFERGDQQVVLVKAMGNAGWDFPSLCVAVDLSPTRAEVTKAQAMFRVQTPKRDKNGDKYLLCDLVMLADPLSTRIYGKYVQDQGGGVLSTNRLVKEGDKTWWTLVNEPPAKAKPVVVSDIDRAATVSDQDKNNMPYDREMAIAQKFRDTRTDSCLNRMQTTQIALFLKQLPNGFEAAEQAIGQKVAKPDLSMKREDLRQALDHHVKGTAAVIFRRVSGVARDMVHRIVWTTLRRMSDVPCDGVKVADLPDEDLRRMFLSAQDPKFLVKATEEVAGFNGGAA